jgi:adenosine deaminase
VELTKTIKPTRRTFRALEQIGALAQHYGIEVRFNAGFPRANDEEENLARVRDWIRGERHPLVTGVDLFGRETKASNLAAGQRLYAAVLEARAQGRTALHTTSHAAGLGEARNPRDVLVLGVERVGHGIALRADPVALEYARSLGAAIEANLTSNIRLGYVAHAEAHPFLDFLRLGLAVSLSTDDEGMLETDISQECALAVERFDLQYAELRQLVMNSVTTSFADEPLKLRLAQALARDLDAFEARWSQFARPTSTRADTD